VAPNIVTAKIAETEIFIAFAPTLASLKVIGVLTLQRVFAWRRAPEPLVHAGGIRDIDIRRAHLFDESGAGEGIMMYIGLDHGPAACVMKLRSNLAEICLNSLRLLVAP